ncbi:MAG: ATP-binding protein [Acidimicrobiia bacterium]
MGFVTVVLAVVVIITVAALIGLAWGVRRIRERLVGVTRQLGDPAGPGGAMTLGRVVDGLEHLAAAEKDRRTDLESELNRLASTLREHDAGIVVIDASGRTVLRNAPAVRLASIRHAEATVDELVTELLGRALDGEPVEHEFQMFGPPRQVVRIRSFPLTDRLAVIGAAAFVEDVSESRRLEGVRRDFVANVSHELKTPIGALGLLAETIVDGDVDDITRQLAERMVREADRLGHTIDDLLDLTMIEAQETPVREAVALRGLLTEAAERLRESADARGIPIVVDSAGGNPAVVGDRRQLLSAVVNLVDNAVKYSDPGQAVELSTGSGPDGGVTVSIRDHGIGIPVADRQRIFERFYRVDEARSRQTGGTGLGLAIVRHIVQVHGGDVEVESTEGEGSLFTLWFPRQQRRRLHEAG